MQDLLRKKGRLKIPIVVYGKLQFNGIQVIRERKVLEVHVDKGMQDGQKIMFSGEGDQEPGLEPGDIVIVLDEKEHQIFR